MMEYKGYIGKVEFDDEAGIFHGEVINTRDVLTFQGRTLDELKTALADTIDDYVEWCRERGKEPERPYSGNFTVRLAPELHRRIAGRDGGELHPLDPAIEMRGDDLADRAKAGNRDPLNHASSNEIASSAYGLLAMTTKTVIASEAKQSRCSIGLREP